MSDKLVKHYQIKASQSLQALFKEIKNYDPLFKTSANHDFFMLAVQFGYSKGRKIPLRGKDVEGFTRPHHLSEEHNAILRAIAFEETGDIAVLSDLIKVYNIAEEYANGGTAHLKECFFDDPGDFTKKLSKMLKEFKPPK